MLFGSRNKKTTYVNAASTTEELKVFGEYIKNINSPLFTEVHTPDFIELMQDEDLQGFSIAYVFNHASEDDAEKFCEAFNVNVVHKKDLKDLHDEMLTANSVEIDPYGPDADQRKIGDIYDIAEEDPWDKRTPEQIQADEEERLLMEKEVAAGRLTNESFTPPPSKEKLRTLDVTEIKTSVDGNGNVQVESVLAIKNNENKIQRVQSDQDVMGNKVADLFGVDEDGKKQFSATIPELDTLSEDIILYIIECKLLHPFMAMETSNTVQNRHKNSGAMIFYVDQGWAVTTESHDAAKLVNYLEMQGSRVDVFPVNKKGEMNISVKEYFDANKKVLAQILGLSEDEIFYRIDVAKSKTQAHYMLSAVMNLLMNEPLLYEKIHYTGLSEQGAWITSRKVLSLDQISSHLKDNGMTTTTAYAVNYFGARLVEDDEIEVVDSNEPEEEQPRPWNGRMEEFLALGDGDEEKAWKHVRGKELIFCSLFMGSNDGTLIYITPAQYFAEHKEPWQGQMKIDHLITPDMKKVDDSDNTYRSRSREEAKITQDLLQKGLIEYLLFNLYINSLQ
jgi:uncharacterized lipoprotein YmbA